MTRRELLAAGIGSALTAVVLVCLQQWSVPGSSVRDARPGGGPAATTTPAAASVTEPGDQAWRTANANLAETVRLTQERLDRNEAERRDLKQQLEQAKAKLAASAGDGAPPRNEFDLTREDWKQLARTGTVKARYPCDFDGNWSLSAAMQASLGLSPSDATAVEKAVKAEEARIAGAIMSGCTKVLRDAQLADRLGPRVCDTVISSSVKDQQHDLQLVADVRAGNVPMPPEGSVDPFAAVTAAMPQLEADLAAMFGPEEAHRLAFADELGSCSGTSGPSAK
jgi:hypothetical protein